MTDSSLNQFVTRGTAAARAAFTPTPPVSSSGYFWFETDTSDTYSWSGSAWVKVNTLSASTGTWTPTVDFGGGSTGLTYSLQNGIYSKSGNIVFLQMDLTISNKGSSTGNMHISGLPFTVNATVPVQVGSPVWSTNAATLNFFPWFGAASGATSSGFSPRKNVIGFTAVTNADVANGDEFVGTMMYRT